MSNITSVFFNFSKGNVSSTAIRGGTGNDSVNFGSNSSTAALATTLYFGYGDGADSVAFAANVTGFAAGSLVVAIDSQYGATSTIGFSSTQGAADRTATFGSGTNQGSIAFSNLFTNVTGGALGAAGITFTTVSTATITALG